MRPTMEKTNMSKRLAVLLAIAAISLLALPIASASAASPWWQLLSGSRPTNLWKATDSVQEIKSTQGTFAGLEGAAAEIKVGGKVVGCLGTSNLIGGTVFCEEKVGFPADKTAAQLEATLKSAFGTNELEVTGGPTGSKPFQVTRFGRPAPGIGLTPLLGDASSKVLDPGGSGRLVLTLSNLGDAPVDATTTPVKITDELPAGVTATGVEAVAGLQGKYGPIDCTLESGSEVTCTYEGALPSYEGIEVEVFVSLTGEEPVAGTPGKVTVSGGDAASASVSQPLTVSPEATPFGIEYFSAQAEEEGGEVASKAGGHPFQFTTTVALNTGSVIPGPTRGQNIVQQPALPRNLRFALPAGLVANPNAVEQCPMAVFTLPNELINKCPDASAIGVASVTVVEPFILGLVREAVPVFNLPPTNGEPARFGFMAAGDPVVIDTAIDPDNHYRATAIVSNVTQLAAFLSSTVSFWGSPGDPRHDSTRGWGCVYGEHPGGCERPKNLSEEAFMRMPVSCKSPLYFGLELEPWNVPIGSAVKSSSFTADPLVACNNVPFDPAITSTPTSKAAENPSGLSFELSLPSTGLANGEGIAESQPKKVEVTLPQGMTLNTSAAEGLAVCSEAQYRSERFNSPPGTGCPEASKIGNVAVKTPLLEEEATGSLYIATPFENPSSTLLSLYIIARVPDRGILVKQPIKVQSDPVTGQLTSTVDEAPQLPFESFTLNFREGARAPLVTPPACGTYETQARITPWSALDPDNPAPGEVITRSSSFQIQRGSDGGACPSGGVPPFHPLLSAGTLNNAAGRYSPFNTRITRTDSEQEITHFSIKLPPGVVGKLAGIPFCSDAAIAAATARTRPHGGAEEIASPSCPQASEVGHSLAGAGVGQVLAYAPGKLYLAGPYKGSQLSLVSVTAAKVGPFDLGTVVVRFALKINPETAEVSVDGATSDPIPHIIQGIPVHLRDIRAYVDRPNFVLNPTSCQRTSTASTILGSGADFSSEADDQPITVTSPFQAAGCASLGFSPKLALSLKGGTKRGAVPALKAVLTARPGDANIGKAQVTLPHSEFLEQSHIKTICTRVQFAAGGGNGEQCPAASIYGRAEAITPLLSEPLSGPVFLRSSSHNLPDLVAALHNGQINIDLDGRIDSVKGGRIRNTFESVPDAPVTKFTLEMRGGKKGLLVNSTNLCKTKNRATAAFTGQNGKLHNFKPVVKPQCGKKKKGKGKSKRLGALHGAW